MLLNLYLVLQIQLGTIPLLRQQGVDGVRKTGIFLMFSTIQTDVDWVGQKKSKHLLTSYRDGPLPKAKLLRLLNSHKSFYLSDCFWKNKIVTSVQSNIVKLVMIGPKIHGNSGLYFLELVVGSVELDNVTYLKQK